MSGLITLFGACQRSKVPREVKNVTVKTDTVEAHEGELSIVYPGKVYAASDISLSFRVAGPIIAVLPEEGAFVKKGQLLAEIDPRDYKIQLAATEAEYKQIKGEAERVMELYKRGSIAINDYEKAVYGLKQITAKYEAHKNALRDTRLLAPFDGYVQKRFYDAHETVAALRNVRPRGVLSYNFPISCKYIRDRRNPTVSPSCIFIVDKALAYIFNIAFTR